MSTTKHVSVYDASRPQTFEKIMEWKKELDGKVLLPNHKPLPVVLVGNKSDLEHARYNKKELDDYCSKNGYVTWLPTSAKNNENVEACIVALVKEILKHSDIFAVQEKKLQETVSLREPLPFGDWGKYRFELVMCFKCALTDYSKKMKVVAPAKATGNCKFVNIFELFNLIQKLACWTRRYICQSPNVYQNC